MPLRLNLRADQTISCAYVEDRLQAAFRNHVRERDPVSAWVLTWPALFLATHPHELAAVYDRKAALNSGLSLNKWLEAFGRTKRTHYRNWKSGCTRIAVALERQRASLAISRGTKMLTLAQTGPDPG